MVCATWVKPLTEPLPHDDSRRLTGPSRWFAGPAVVLTPRGPLARDEAAWAAWAGRVRTICAGLGWPDPAPVIHRHAGGAFLAFAAPEQALFTATDVNEWAWAPHGPLPDFAARARDERVGPLQRLKQAARERGLPFTDDDETLGLGEGQGSLCYARGALPLALDVPWQRLHGIPKALVTGSNGKTTTVRLVAAMARSAGHVPGLSCTEGVFVAGRRVQHGDWSGPAGARAVLRDPAVTMAVLETARGGIARRGLAVERAEVAVVTNVSADHFGEYGIDGVADLAELKLVVARAVAWGGLLVANADDPVLMAAVERLPHARAARQARFALSHHAPALIDHRARSGATCAVHEGRLRLWHGGSGHDLGAVADLPLALGGAAAYNLMNAAAAALAAFVGLGLPLEAIRATLQSFGRDPADNPGRLERWQSAGGATVLVDYAHNPDGLAQLLAVARALPHRRLLLLLGQAGNRDDAAIGELARVAAAAQPDLIVVKELRSMLRGRPAGEVPGLLLRALPPEHARFGGDEADAALLLLSEARAGDVVVLPLHDPASRDAALAGLVPG